jgi:hypothetical protein
MKHELHRCFPVKPLTVCDADAGMIRCDSSTEST